MAARDPPRRRLAAPQRRYAADDNPDCNRARTLLWKSAPSAAERRILLAALNEGLQGKRDLDLGIEAKYVARAWNENRDDPLLARLAIRCGVPDAGETIVARARPARAALPSPEPARHPGRNRAGRDAFAAYALAGGRRKHAPSHRGIAGDRARPGPIARRHDPGGLSQHGRHAAQVHRDVLLAKRDWAGLLLDRVERGEIAAQEIPVEQLRIVAAHGDADLDARVKKLWGNIRPPTAEERLAVVRRLNNDLRAAAGRPHEGRAVFRKHCGTCHALFGEGEKIGPDLTTANRRDRDYLLVSIVDPSAVVRKEYANFTLTTTDGRILTGLIAEQDAANVTLLTAKNERPRLARGQIDALEESPNSLMPENLFSQLSPQELRDLFAWLEQPVPPAGGAK